MTTSTMLSYLPFSATIQQAEILNSLEKFVSNDEDFVVIKGAAGTGKTSIMKAVVDFLGSRSIECQLLAPMGRAAKTIAHKTETYAKTAHSCIYVPVTDVENAMVRLERKNNENSQRQVFIVDESSMISDKMANNEEFVVEGALLTELLRFVKQGNTQSKIIFVGDGCQLLPVGYQTCEISPALCTDYLTKKFNLIGSELALTQVMRQDERSDIYKIANEIRQNIIGNCSMMPRSIGNYFSGEEQAVSLYLERFELGKQDKVAIVTFANSFKDKCNALIRSRLGLKGNLAVGDTVMLNQNYMGQHYVASGEIGVVKNIASSIKKVAELDFVEAEIMFTNERNVPFTVVSKVLLNSLYEEVSKEKKIALFASAMRNNPTFRSSKDIRNDEFLSALQLSYGHAMTGHKAQGSEWDTVILNTWTKCNDLRFLYTGVTRARKELFGNGAYKYNNVA
jgi:exodeoxyribonuclease V